MLIWFVYILSYTFYLLLLLLFIYLYFKINIINTTASNQLVRYSSLTQNQHNVSTKRHDI